MEGMFSAIARAALDHPDTHFLVATHPNPTVSAAADRILGRCERVDLIGSQGYLAFVKLMGAAHMIVSASGGIQEEGPALGTPVLVLRDVTEYPELVERGVVEVVGTDETRIVAALSELLDDPARYERMKRACGDYGPESSASVIVEALRDPS
jgi:UDP-N-acetylglucosamine 2-epimerase (non-hydrolysing)